MVKRPDVHIRALGAAAAALEMQLRAEAAEQGSYVHKFPDGKLSVELEWFETNSLAMAAVLAYLDHVKVSAERNCKASGDDPGERGFCAEG
jgi:hypothetical protein